MSATLDQSTGHTALTGILIVAAFSYIIYFASRTKTSVKIPTYKAKANSFVEIIMENSSKFRNDVYKLAASYGDVVIIPPAYVEGLKALPENQLSFNEVTHDRFMGDYTLLGGHIKESQAIIQSVRNDLTRHIGKVMTELQDEIAYGFSTEMPACDDWTPVKPMIALLRVVALVSGRVFVGPELNRNEDFLECSITFTLNIFQSAEKVREHWPIFRRIATYFIPEIKKCNESLAKMKSLMKPILKERHRLAADAQTENIADMVSWNIANASANMAYDLDFQAYAQLLVSMAAIHTTSLTSTNAWLDLAAHPEYLDRLRREVVDVLASEPAGALTKTGMSKLRKLDSFLKESQRMHPLGAHSFDRKVTARSLTLPNGLRLPRGTYIAAPNLAPSSCDDLPVWQDPERFDGFRFEKMRARPGFENRFQFASTGTDSLNFGHGTHACPGRFFAANEIKLILVHLIMNYDIKLPDGEVRPKDLISGSVITPDPSKAVLLKRRA